MYVFAIFVALVAIACALAYAFRRGTDAQKPRHSADAQQPPRRDSGAQPDCRGAVVKTRSPDGHLVYSSGYDACGKTVRCSGETRVHTRVPYRWHEAYEHKLEHWPVEIYDESTGACRATAPSGSDADDSRILAPDFAVRMTWTKAMRSRHRFSLLSRQFICGDPLAKYRWDYDARRVVTLLPDAEPHDPSKQFVDTGMPCQRSAVPLAETQWGLAERVLMFPDKRMPLLVAERFDRELFPDFIAWPRRLLESSGNVAFDVLRWSYASKSFSRSRYESDIAPLGFSYDDNSAAFVLEGFGTRPDSLLDPTTGKETYSLYTIASGSFDTLRFYGNDRQNEECRASTTEYTSPAVLDLRKTITHSVALPFVTETVAIGENFARISPRGVEIFGEMHTERIWNIKLEKQSDASSTLVTFNRRKSWSRVVTFDAAEPLVVLRSNSP